MALVPPQPQPKEVTEISDSCTAEHCYYAFDALYCSLTKAKPIPPPFPDEKYPLFVTWNIKNGSEWHLRGCIGNFQAMALHEGLAEYALISAFRDSRFRKIDKSELERLECGVSLLTDFEYGESYLDWTIGVHGISIRFPHPSLTQNQSSSETPSPYSSSRNLPKVTSKQSFSATYLPQVIPEQGWDKIEAVDSAIHKAGWRGRITEDLRRSIKLERYQSSLCSVTWDEYFQWRKQNEQ
ncbi:AMMECR1 domain-containing protein [Flammula alnicola]|nr:AMMECR1 domain-containing protein [Flammula alnicola]